jgi:hypothetical protein
MTLRVTMLVAVRPLSDGKAEVEFLPLHGAEPIRDLHGGIARFAFPLGAVSDDDLADLVRVFARWTADLAVGDVQTQRRAVYHATERPAKPQQ